MFKAVDIVGNKISSDKVIPYLVEVQLSEPTSDTFLKVRETLTRIGIHAQVGDDKPTLFQTCHILSKRGKYYICHFKTLFVLDDRDNNITVGDIARQNLIIQLLSDWGMVKVVKPDMIKDTMCSMSNIKIVKYEDRDGWNLMPKYNIGAKVKGS